MDCTPAKVVFGKLHSKLAPIARYWWKEAAKTTAKGADDNTETTGVATLAKLSYEEFKRRKGGKEPYYGTLEMMAQTARISFPTCIQDLECVETAPLHMAPCFVARGTGSNILAAVDAACSPLRMDKLKELAQKVPIVFLCIGADLAASNSRMKHRLAEWAGDHNATAQARGVGVILLVDLSCSAHIIWNGIIDKVFATHMLVTKLYSIAFCVQVTSLQTRTVAARCRENG
jgi:hypothetical protein